jgi:hypothetical protein
MSDHAELIERLRRAAQWVVSPDNDDGLSAEAATAIAALVAERDRYREVLETIRDRHIPDQPMAKDIDEADYARSKHTELRSIARAALAQGGEP